MPVFIVRFIILSTGIFLGGWLGMKMAVPPGYSSPLWPPAGLALAALLIWGKNLWPAVLLGAVANKVLAGGLFGGELDSGVLASAALISVGSTAQALCAAWLSEKYLEPGVPRLDSPGKILWFFLLTGPVACLIAPSVGVSSLLALNILGDTQTWTSWWQWWIGDSLGVLIVSPLLFCLCARPRDFWAPRRLRVALPLMVTLLVLITVFVLVYRAERSRIQSVFDNQAVAIDRLLIEHADNVVDNTLALRDLYHASDDISRHAFSMFSQAILARHPELQALEWLPRVPDSALTGFEGAIRDEGYRSFRVVELDAAGALVPVGKRSEYFPVTFIEPMLGNEKALGLDSTANPISRQSKNLAALSGKPTASQRLTLIQRNDRATAVLVSIPVYGYRSEEVDQAVHGFVSAVVLPARMVETALLGLDVDTLAIHIRDLDAPAAERELFSKQVLDEPNAAYALRPWLHEFQFCDRTWQLSIAPGRRFLAMHGSMLPWITLISGLGFTGLLSILLLTVSGRTANIEALVDSRTAALQKANDELQATEHTLRESENRLRTLVHSQPECVKLLARDGSLLEMNRAGLEMIEANSLQQVQGANVLPMILPKYRRAFKNSINRVFAGESATLEFEIHSLKGTHRWLDTQAVPMRDGEGNIVALLGLTRDITERKRMETALRESEQKLANILNNLSAYVYLKDTEDRYLYANRPLCELWRVTPEQVIGSTDHQFFDAETAARIRASDRRVLSGGETLKVEETNQLGKTGKTATYLSTKLPLRNEKGEIYALVGISTDITERKQAEDRLKLAARVFGEAHEGILITDAEANIVDVNPTFCEITGYSRDEIVGKKPSMLQSGKHSREFYLDLWKTLAETRHWQGEVWNRKKNGELYAELLTISALCDEAGAPRNYVGLFSDITQSKQQQQMLELLAHYDPLTRLPNRTLFADRLMQAMAHSRRDKSLLAICFLDLDGFKPVNDQFGHEAGDRVLIEVAERIRHNVREEDSVSRHGGDEFALLLGDLQSLDECKLAIARIHQAISEPIIINSQAVSVGASTGITVFPLDDADPDTLLRHADHAMYQAKLAGKNRYHLFDASQDRQTIDKHNQLRDLEAAFADRQFCLYYQPKVNIKTGKVVGVEALIRWRHPERGLVSPLTFLPALASSELEIDIGNWVIEQAWRQCAAWYRQGVRLEVSVNISAYHLLWPGFATHLESVLAQAPDIASRYLQLEILESTALDDLSAVNRVVGICRNALGITIALDDFGTGYSSLTHLRHLPVDTVKIDQGFVRDMLDDPDDYAIVESVIGLSHAFRHEVIAEGVESPEQGAVLLLLGCQLAQGYAIAKPMLAGEMVAWVANYRPHPDWRLYASRDLTSEQTQIAIRRIDARQWLQRVDACLASKHNNVGHWPIMEPPKSHFGRWIRQAQQHRQYDEAWLEDVAAMHRELLQKGNILMHRFWEGEGDEVRAGFAELRALWQRLDDCLAKKQG